MIHRPFVCMLASSAALLLRTPLAAAQESPPPWIPGVLELHRVVREIGRRHGEELWPGFRPDTIPQLYVVAGAGKALLGWRDSLPEGFRRLPAPTRGGWAGTESVSLPSARGIAFLSFRPDEDSADVVGLAVHEAFHSFESSLAAEGRTFGSRENAYLVRSYPVFDVENEALFALEGRLLHRALAAPDDDEARRLARRFLAVRERRQGRLAPEMAEFEREAELNEGLAQYVLVRAQRLLARDGRLLWGANGHRAAEEEVSRLDSLLSLGERSFRRRYYVTGVGEGLLLDRLAGNGWKRRLMSRNLTLQGILARTVGSDSARAASSASLSAPGERAELTSLRAAARHAVARREAEREERARRLLASPGVRLVLSPRQLPDRRFQSCGFDPQNLLQLPGDRLLHARFLRPCAGQELHAEFDRPVLEDLGSGTLRAALPSWDSLRLSADGRPLDLADGEARIGVADFALAGPNVELHAASADVARSGDLLLVEPGAPRSGGPSPN